MSAIKSSKPISIRDRNYPFLKLPSSEATALTSPAFSPRDVPGMKAWWDADSIPLSIDGSTVSTWRDLSGNSFDLTIGTGTPVIKKNILNGKSVVRFDGSTRMTCANVLDSKNRLSIFVVWIPRTTVINILLEQGISDLSLESTGSLHGTFYVGQVGGAQASLAGVQNVGHYNTLIANGTQLRNYKNGAVGTAVNFTGNTSSSIFNLGARFNNSFATTSDVAELIVYDRDVTNEERISIERYFAQKYGFSVTALTFPTTVPVRARWAPENMIIVSTTFTWADASGNGYHAVKTGTIPSIVTGLNGESAAQGTNSTDMRLPVSNGSTMLAMPRFATYAIFQTPTTPQNLQAVYGASRFGGSDGNGFTTNMFNLEFTSASYPCTMRFRDGTNNRRLPNGTLYAGDVNAVSTQTFTAGQWVAFYLEHDGYNIRANWNGFWTADSIQNGVIIPPANFYLMGTDYAPDFQFGGKLHEAGIISDLPTAAQRSALFQYIRNRYGLNLE